jgi:hypothetical protein
LWDYPASGCVTQANKYPFIMCVFIYVYIYI